MSEDSLVLDPFARAERRLGRVLRDKWTLDALVGVGGMAAVYAATHRNGNRVAVKMLHAELSADPGIRQRFLREGYVANKVGHPGAVNVSDDDVAEDGACFLVMALLEGETVETRRERKGGTLGTVDTLSIMEQVLDVLAAAHAQGIVHRDLKPENLFVTRDGSVKVLDFGIARLREGAGVKGTHTGISMGTPSYMANEQARALWDEVDARTDLWAIGATMFTCLTGRLVHEGRTGNEQLLSAMTKPAPLLRSLAPNVPRPVADVVDRALSFERDARYPSAREMQAALRAAYEAMTAAPISTAPRLVVPELALEGTLPSMDVQPVPSREDAERRTDDPVAGQAAVSSVPSTFRRNAALGVAALGVVAVAAIFLARNRAPAVPDAAAPPRPNEIASIADAPAAAPPPSAPSEIEVSPVASKDASPRKPPGKPPARTVPPPTSAPPDMLETRRPRK